ncbi:MAG: hypothetical protein EOP50_21250, partial [Sphingobacteriales bacterium]
MKQLMSICVVAALFASCSGEGSGTKTYNTTDAAEQHNPSSDPNPQMNNPIDTTTGDAHDTST